MSKYDYDSVGAKQGRLGEEYVDNCLKRIDPGLQIESVRALTMEMFRVTDPKDFRLDYTEKIWGDKIISRGGRSTRVEVCTTVQPKFFKVGESKYRRCEAEYFAIVRLKTIADMEEWEPDFIQFVTNKTFKKYAASVLGTPEKWDPPFKPGGERLVRMTVNFGSGMTPEQFLEKL